MLAIAGRQSRYCDGLSRRSLLRIGALGMGGLALPDILKAESQAGKGRGIKGIIMVIMPGGPSHLDMYDLKPDAPVEIRGEFQPIGTNVPGIEICELLPRLAGMADRTLGVHASPGAQGIRHVHAEPLAKTGRSRSSGAIPG